MPFPVKQQVILLLAVFASVQLAGCAGMAPGQQIREGFLNIGLAKQAFLDAWGKPDQTNAMSADEMTRASVERGGGSLQKGKSSYEIWEYKKYGTALVFSGNNLVNWSTTKSKNERRRICHTDPTCAKK